MSLRGIATKVAKTYIAEHPGCDSEMIFMIVENAIELYKRTDYDNPVSFFNIQIRNTLYRLGLYSSRTRVEPIRKNTDIPKIDNTNKVVNEVDKDIKETKVESKELERESKEMSEEKNVEVTEERKIIPRMSSETRAAIIEDLRNGLTVVAVSEKWKMKNTTMRNNVMHWKRSGLIDFEITPAVRGRVKKDNDIVSKEIGNIKNTEIPDLGVSSDIEVKSSTENEGTEVVSVQNNIDIKAGQEKYNSVHNKAVTVQNSINTKTEQEDCCSVHTVVTPTESTEKKESHVTWKPDSCNIKPKVTEELSFITASQDVVKFIEKQIQGYKLVAISADEQKKSLLCKYKRGNSVLTLKLDITDEQENKE